MGRKRWVALATILILLLTGVYGCKSPNQEEGAASVEEYVEGEEQQPSSEAGNGPVKVENEEKQPSTPNGSNNNTNLPAGNNSSGTGNSGNTANSGTTNPDQPDPKPDSGNNNPGDSGNSDDPSISYDAANKLKIVSYNIRCGNDSNGRSIKERAPRLKKVLDQYQPDIMGFQEAVPEWMTYLEGYYGSEYEHINVWRADNSKEGTPLFWRKDKFETMETGHFWLSETPQTSSISWGATHPRICMWAKLKVKATGKILLFYNTHFDFTAEAHANSAKLIIRQASAKGGFSKYAVFSTADYNMFQWKEGYTAMQEKFDDVNWELDKDPTPTGHGYNKDNPDNGIIDYCFYSRDLCVPLRYKVMTEMIDGNYVSDHWGVYAEVALI